MESANAPPKVESSTGSNMYVAQASAPLPGSVRVWRAPQFNLTPPSPREGDPASLLPAHSVLTHTSYGSVLHASLPSPYAALPPAFSGYLLAFPASLPLGTPQPPLYQFQFPYYHSSYTGMWTSAAPGVRFEGVSELSGSQLTTLPPSASGHHMGPIPCYSTSECVWRASPALGAVCTGSISGMTMCGHAPRYRPF